MRNVFDQYKHAENRLTHALAVSLDEDRELLKEFLRWVGVAAPVPVGRLVVTEQTVPGEAVPTDDEEEAERRGLPDLVVHDGEEWCVLVESKVQAGLYADQLLRHAATVRRRGFERVACVALTKAGVAAPPGTIGRTWSGLYELLGASERGREWPDRLRSYLRAAEVRLARDEYLTEGTLTMFDGFPFSADNPYTYGEAKRLLKLALAELRKDASLRRIGMDPDAPGRGAITGKGGKAVWDFLPLADRPRNSAFTAYPHLTLAVHTDHLEASVTIPNGVTRAVRGRLAALGVERLVEVNRKILRRARPLIARGGHVRAYALQRHYLGQRSAAITDAMMSFRLETSQPRGAGRVKGQPEWVSLYAELPRRKRSNLQFQYRVELPWGTKGLDSRDSIGLIAASWLSLAPLLDALRETRSRQDGGKRNA